MNENQTRLLLILGSMLTVLLLALIVVLVTRDDGSSVAAVSSATSVATDDTVTTAVATSSTVAPTTTAISTTTSPTTTAAPTTTTTAAPTTTTTAAPPPDFALRFDGVDDFVSVFDSGDFDFGSTMTVEAWIKPTSLPEPPTFSGLLQGALTEPPFSGGSWVLVLDRGDHSSWGLSACTPGCNAATSGPGGLTVDVWQHVAGTYDGTMLRTYYNGALVASAPLSGDLSAVGYVLIGTWEDSFRGLIDEVRVWSVTRSPAQIDASRGQVLAGSESGLVGYWRFNEGSGQVAADSSTRGNDGKLGAALGADPADPAWAASDVPVG